jgi:O-antigen ligase
VGNVAFRCLWCFVFVLPWDVLADFPLVGSIPRLVGLIASGVGVLHILARRRVRPLTWFHVFAVLFVLWAGVTSFWSLDPQATRTQVVTYVQLLVFVWLLWEIASSPERQQALLRAYVLGASVAAVLTIQNYLSGARFVLATDTRFAALNQDPNDLGLTLALGIPMAWYVSLSQLRTRMRWLWRLYLPLAIVAVLLTASRGATLVTLVALMIIPWTHGRLRPGAKVALYALGIVTLLVAMAFVPETSLERLTRTRADAETGYLSGRGLIWAAGLDVAWEHPLIGVGAGAFEAAVEPALHQRMAAHDVPLSILVDDGAVGLFLFLAMVAAALQPLRRLSRLQQRFSIVLLLALGIGSLSLSWDTRKQFWFVLGFAAVQTAQRGARKPRGPCCAPAALDWDDTADRDVPRNAIAMTSPRPGA